MGKLLPDKFPTVMFQTSSRNSSQTVSPLKSPKQPTPSTQSKTAVSAKSRSSKNQNSISTVSLNSTVKLVSKPTLKVNALTAVTLTNQQSSTLSKKYLYYMLFN